jgi:putative ABC transport system permease protein
MGMWLDILQVGRLLRRSPASAAATVLTLALTLGAGAAIFAVVDAILLTPPPFADPDALVTVRETPENDPSAPVRAVPYLTFEAWRDRIGPRAVLEASDGTNLTLTELGPAERVSASNVTPGFLKMLGVTPARGRDFADSDVGRPVVIVSDRFWRTKLGGDNDVIGRTIVLSRQAHTIVGVLPPQLSYYLLRPIPVAAAQLTGSRYPVHVIARLAEGTTSSEFARTLNEVSRNSSPRAAVVVTSMTTALTGTASGTLAMLAGAGALAMLIAFANLGGLLTVRAIDRRRELAVRAALGARRGQIVRHLLLEAEALVLLGLCGGVVLAWWLTPFVARLVLEQFGGVANRPLTVSWRVIGTVGSIAIALAWLCGVLPALMAARRSAVDTLRRGVTPQRREVSLRRAFVAAEIALAFVLLVSVVVVGRSLFAALAINPGFDPRGLLTMNVALPRAGYPTDDSVVSFYTSLEAALEERFGADAVAVVDEIPLTGDRGRRLIRPFPSHAGIEANTRAAGALYFRVMRIPVLAGRSFSQRDDAMSTPRAIVSQSLADRLFDGASPIGRQIWIGPVGPPVQPTEIVGVVGDVKQGSLDEATVPTIYLSLRQAPSPGTHIVVRSSQPDAATVGTLREEVARLDRELPVYGVRTMNDVVARSRGVPARRVLASTFTGFAILAVVLCAIGLMGIVAHDVAARRTELALRLALGADPSRLLGATYLQAVTVLSAGVAIGAVLSIWTTRALGAAVVLRGGLDPLSVGVAVAVLAGVCAFAILPIARRASRTDPALALRGEQ